MEVSMVTLYAVLTVLAGALLENFFILRATHHLSALIILVCSLLLSLVLSTMLLKETIPLWKKVWRDNKLTCNERILDYSNFFSITIVIISLTFLIKAIVAK
jgi:hypothetical protein